MKKRKHKILKAYVTSVEKGGTMLTFQTKAGSFRYFLSNMKVRKRFYDLNPHLLSKNTSSYIPVECVGRFLFVPERSK